MCTIELSTGQLQGEGRDSLNFGQETQRNRKNVMKRRFSSSQEEEREVEEVEEDVESIEARLQQIPSPRLTLSDPDVLECPICNEYLSPPVYQCENGHLACDPCCGKIGNKCPSCRKPIGRNIRCRAIEKVLETTKISCKNMQYGCIEEIRNANKLNHEATCKYAPCTCPHPSCEYVGMYKCLYKHFSIHHQDSSKQFTFDENTSISLGIHDKHAFLQETKYNTLFVMNRSIEPSGSSLNIVCVAPTSSTKEYSYSIFTTRRYGRTTIYMSSTATFTSNWGLDSPAEDCLIVPNCFIDSCGLLHLGFTIRRLKIF